jgi:3-hydroxyisobutyrate dehydrogenase-like beta-hydroxyacid dehydrogenase
MSSIDPLTMLCVAKEVEARGANVLDASVSGGPEVAKRGELVIMVAGRRRTVDQNVGILNALGWKIIYVGAIGNGKMAKLANDTLASLNNIAAREVVNWSIIQV